MSIVYFDGYDWYSSSSQAIQHKGYTVFGTVSAAYSRDGYGKGMRGNTVKLFENQVGKTCVFCSPMKRGAASITSVTPLLHFLEDYNKSQVTLSINTDNKLCIYVGDDLKDTGTTDILLNGSYFIEIKMFIDSTVGVFQVRVDGVVELEVTDGFVQAQATNGLRGVQFTNTFFYWDNTYFLNSDGTLWNDYLGELVCRNGAPEADVQKQFTRSADDGVQPNYTAINEAITSPANPYVYSNTVGHTDKYSFPTLTGVGAIVVAMEVISLVGKSDGSPRTFKQGAIFGTNTKGEVISIAKGYTTQRTLIQDKDGVNPITTADVNSMNSFIKVES